MSALGSLFDVPVEALKKPKAKAAAKPSVSKAKKDAERGCEYCTLNEVRGIKKIMGRVRGRGIAIFAQSPGPEENDEGRLLVGASGQLLWEELERVGITPKDCDVQNAVRCFPADWKAGYHSDYLKMRNPSAKEIHCCSIHTERAFEDIKATQILIFGQVAAKAVLKTRSLPQSKTFWSDVLKAKVYLLDHPSLFIRAGKTGERFKAWRKLLESVAADREILQGENIEAVSDKFWYIKQQKYVAVTDYAGVEAAEKDIRRAVRKHRRVGMDIEANPKGEVTCCGISPRPGVTHVFILDHKDVTPDPSVRAALAAYLSDPHVKKTFHFGCTDVEKLIKAGFTVKGYTHDTFYSEYLRYSDLKAYGLDKVAERRFPQFSGYHTIIADEMLAGVDVPPRIANGTPEEKYKYVEDNGLFDITKLSLPTLVLYNGADCDVTTRIERDNSRHVPPALMRLYIDLGFLLHEMEPQGPLFDFAQHEKLDVLYPIKTKALTKQIRKVIRKETNWYKHHETFNPASPDQVKEVLYSGKTGFGFDYPFASDRKKSKPNTEKMTLLTLGREHVFPLLILEWRSSSKVQGTYLNSYVFCARSNEGRLRTKWNGSGTRTGRLSSSGDKNKKASKRINLQNIKKDPQMQNLCVADTRWPEVYARIERILKKKAPLVLRYWAECDEGAKAAKQAGEKWKAPDMSAGTRKQLRRAARAIEIWLGKHMPDFKTFVIADYGQVEVRVAAQMAGDENLIADCEKSDIHTTVGVAMTGWAADRIANDDMTRTLTKNVHFAILFGASEDNVFAFINARTEPETRAEILKNYARDYPDEEPLERWKKDMVRAYRRYFKRYPKIRRFIEAQREFAEANHFVTTLFGMIQTLNVTTGFDAAAESVDEGERGAYWGNQCLNGPVQGTAHQLMICALVNLIRKRKKYQMLGVPPLEVHDALYFAFDVLRLKEGYAKIKYLLEQESLKTVRKDFPEIDWKVPIEVDIKAGVRLGTKVKVTADTEPGLFLVDWFRVCRNQITALDKELLACAA